MYSRKVTERQLQALEKSLGFEPRYHNLRECQQAISSLDKLYDPETGKPSRPLQADEIRWIRNERAISQCDFRYWWSNYWQILHWGNQQLVHAPLNVAQQITLDVWGEMEEAGHAIMTQDLKARQLGKCLGPLTRVLTTDLRWIAVDDVTVGTELISVDEGYPRGRGNSRKLRRAVVLAREEVYSRAIAVTMESGVSFTATPEHRFLVKSTGGKKFGIWKEVGQLRVGDQVRFITEPWHGQDYEDGWFGGMLDGEGSIRNKTRAGCECCVAQVLGPVYDRAVTYLRERGYSFREEKLDERTPEHSSKFGRNPVAKVTVGRVGELFRLIGQTRPTRMLKKNWWEGKCLPGKRTGITWSTVRRLEALPAQRMIDLQTSTGTFIAEGLVSHNSTIVEGAVAHRAQMYSHVKAVVGSSDPNKSPKIAQMMERGWAGMPWWLMPERTKDISGKLIEFGFQGSSVSILHGTAMSGMARGDTPTVAHLSEIPDYNNPEEDIDASLVRAMHETPWTFLVLESTAKGRHDYWHRTWLHSKENWPRGRARLRPIFLPWFVGTDLYPTETWLRMRPIPPDWSPADITIHHAERARAYVRSEPTLQKYLGADWVMPLAQMWFWEVEYEEYKAKKATAKFLEEMPADDNEAFQSSNLSVFDVDIITDYRQACQPPEPWGKENGFGVFGIRADTSEIPARLQAGDREVNPNLPPINIKANWNPSQGAHHYTLVPLKWHGYPLDDGLAKIYIWEFPENGETFGLGVDTADGIGADRSVIEGLRAGTLDRNDAQVFEFASPYINSMDLWPFCMALGTLYSTVSKDGTRRQCRQAIECRNNGENCQLELRKHGWTNFHRWTRYDNKRLTATNKLGWFTLQWSRDMLMDRMIKYLRDGWLDIRSPFFVDEMNDLERDEVRQKIKAEFGGNDDRWMALGIILISIHILEMRANRKEVAVERAAARQLADVPVLYAPDCARSDLAEYSSGSRIWTPGGRRD